MTGRPDLSVMEAILLDGRGRLRPEMIAVEFRCQRKRHQQGAIIRTAYGPLLVWRAERGPAARWQWMRDWLDAVPDAVLMTCNCGVMRLVDVAPHRRDTMR
jgi:hypothetical protein